MVLYAKLGRPKSATRLVNSSSSLSALGAGLLRESITQ